MYLVLDERSCVQVGNAWSQWGYSVHERYLNCFHDFNIQITNETQNQRAVGLVSEEDAHFDLPTRVCVPMV